MNVDLIKVLVCTFQGEKYIAEQLNSILHQDYSPIEIFVFDDCSTDNTIKIINAFCTRHPNIYLFENTHNIGFLKNFEKALNSIKGRYIALSDQDDIWQFNKLTLSMLAMKEAEKYQPDKPVLIHSDLSLINEEAECISPSFFEKKKIYLPGEKSLASILGHCGVMGNTILMNQLLVNKALPFPLNLKYHDYWLALVNELFGIRRTLPQVLVQYRIHGDNSSQNSLTNSALTPKFNGFMKLLQRDYPLPFMEDKREELMSFLLKTYQLPSHDRQLIEEFRSYLVLKEGRLYGFFFLLKNGLLKGDFIYRMSVFFRILLTKRYTNLKK